MSSIQQDLNLSHPSRLGVPNSVVFALLVCKCLTLNIHFKGKDQQETEDSSA